MLIFLHLEQIVEGDTSNNLTNVSIRSLIVFGGMLEVDLVNKVLCFGANGITIFQSLKISVNVQLTNKHCPFLIGIHYMAYKCNLVVQTLSSQPLLQRLKLYLLVCTPFTTSPQKGIWSAPN